MSDLALSFLFNMVLIVTVHSYLLLSKRGGGDDLCRQLSAQCLFGENQ